MNNAKEDKIVHFLICRNRQDLTFETKANHFLCYSFQSLCNFVEALHLLLVKSFHIKIALHHKVNVDNFLVEKKLPLIPTDLCLHFPLRP